MCRITFFWGSPRKQGELDAFETAVNDRWKDEQEGKFNAVSWVDQALERVTDKSAALLQADSILAAVATYFAYQPPVNVQWIILANKVALLLALASCLVVLFNLTVIWAKNPNLNYRDPQADFKFAISIFKSRATRFTFALVLSIAAFTVALVAASAAIF